MTRILALLLLAGAAPASALNVRNVRSEAVEETREASTAASSAVSLSLHLQLRLEQAERLDRLYEGYAARRLEHEVGIERRQSELARAQSPASFDARRAEKLARQNSEAEQKITSGLLAARAQALKVLSPVQRAQLESLSESLDDGRVRLRRDRYFQLLLMPADEREPLPLPRDARTREVHERSNRADRERSNRNRSARRKGTVSYGAYGGYGYGGPQYGVGASYGRGPIGVHAGIGRGGPSLGVSIGGILGRGW